MGRKLTTLVLALLVGLAVGTAAAHVASSGQVRFYQKSAGYNRPCGVGEGVIGHGDYGHGGARATTWSVQWAVNTPCAAPNRKPGGAVRAIFTYQRKRDGHWAFCDSAGWHWNGNDEWIAESRRNYARFPCGRAFYRTIGAHQVWAADAWRSGFTNSCPCPDGHYFGRRRNDA